MNHYSPSYIFNPNEDKQQIEREIKFHKEQYCGQYGCYSEYDYATFREYVPSVERLYQMSDALVFNINKQLSKSSSVQESEKTNWGEMKDWANGVISDMVCELVDSLNAIVTSGHELSDDDINILNATEIYRKIK